jgi:hypothetical protein
VNQFAHRCVVCRKPVTGPVDGVAFGVQGRFLFTTCLDHAPVVRAGAKTAMRAVGAGINTFIDRKMPTLGKVLREVRAVRDKELEA